MAEKGKSGRPRYVEMQDYAREILSQIPLGSEVQVTAFSDSVLPAKPLPFNTQDERASAISFVTQMCEKPHGKTRLFDTLGTIFANAETIFHGDREREVRVLVFTDGLDTTSKEWTQSTLLARFSEVVSEHPNVWLFLTSIDKSKSQIQKAFGHLHIIEQAFTRPILVKTKPLKVTLRDPRVFPEQEVEIEFAASSSEWWKLLEGRTVKLSLNAECGIEGASIGPAILQPGPIRVPIAFSSPNPIGANACRNAEIKLEYPEVPGWEIRAASSIRVDFEISEPPYISVNAGNEVNWRRPTTFEVRNAGGAEKVRWFVDGMEVSETSQRNSDARSQIERVFLRTGDHSVTSELSWPNGDKTAVEARFRVVASAPIAKARYEIVSSGTLSWLLGSYVRLVDESEGDVVKAQWLVNDQPVNPAQNGLWLSRRRDTHIKLLVSGPADDEDISKTVQSEFIVPADSFARWRTPIFGSLATILLVPWLPWFFSRLPYDSILQRSCIAFPGPSHEFEEAPLKEYWQPHRQLAIVPIGRLFPTSHYWSQNSGAREYLEIRLGKSRRHQGPAVRYSGGDSPYAVTSPLFRDEHPGFCFRIFDSRCEDERFRELYFRLVPGKLQRSSARVAILAALCATCFAGAAIATALI